MARGRYLAQWPVFIVDDHPADLSVTVAMDDPLTALYPGTPAAPDQARRRYLTRLARKRLHQAAFRERVLVAYRRTCSMCSLRHEKLLEAAHILPDGHPRGLPLVPNGLALCKLRHAVFDVNIVGVRPDLIVEVGRRPLPRSTDLCCGMGSRVCRGAGSSCRGPSNTGRTRCRWRSATRPSGKPDDERKGSEIAGRSSRGETDPED